MNSLNQILLTALPVVISLSILEALVLTWLRRQRAAGSDGGIPNTAIDEPYDWRAMGVSLADQAGRMLLRFVPISIATPAFALAEQHRLFTLELSGIWMFLLLFIGQEFCYYWFHRAAHRVRWFWANHAVHHSPNQLNLSAAYRLGWMGKVAGAAIFFTPLVWLGFDARIVLVVLSINLLYQFWIHAAWIPKLGFLEGILNTPSAHRVHHASNLPYLDANYGGVLVIFDRLFGTYVPERDDEPCIYGLVKPVRSYNPLVVEFAQWTALARDVFNAKSISSALGYIWRPPGWSPEGPGETTEAMRAAAGLTSAHDVIAKDPAGRLRSTLQPLPDQPAHSRAASQP